MVKKFEQHSNYSLFIPGKSWIFVNPSHGCPQKCAYCIEKKDRWFKNRVTQLYSPKDTTEKMVNSPIILKDRTPLAFYNFSDPFLKDNKKNLFSILENLDKKGWKNKVGLITKLHPGRDYLKKLSELENLKIGLFVSYANLIPGIENTSPKNRIKLMEDSKRLGLKTINYTRPLVKIWTNEEKLSELADQIKGKVDAISLSGIRLTPEIILSLKSKGIPLPEIRTYTNKQRETPFFKKVTKLLKEKTGVPVFWHTSCAMSYVYKEPDYNSHDIRDKMKEGKCSFPCADEQREICYSRKGNSSEEEINEILKKLEKDVSYKRKGETLFLKGNNLTREDVSFVRHLLPEFVKKDEKKKN